MSQARARQAIEIKLMAWAAARPIRVANFEQGFEAGPDETYLQAFQLPAGTTCRYLGSDAYEYTGVYQVSIVCPGFEGLVTEPVDQGPTITESATYTVPASFTYRGIADQPPAGA